MVMLLAPGGVCTDMKMRGLPGWFGCLRGGSSLPRVRGLRAAVWGVRSGVFTLCARPSAVPYTGISLGEWLGCISEQGELLSGILP